MKPEERERSFVRARSRGSVRGASLSARTQPSIYETSVNVDVRYFAMGLREIVLVFCRTNGWFILLRFPGGSVPVRLCLISFSILLLEIFHYYLSFL